MKALHRHRRVLEDLAGAVYESLPGPVVDGAGRLHPLLAMLAGHHCGVSEIFGRTRIGGLQARILAAGSGPGIEYLLRRFFGTVTRRRPIARVPLPRLARFLERRRGDYDLALARVDRLSGRLLLGRDYLALPEWVGTRLPVPADPERHARGSKSLRNDMRKAARNGLTCRISRDESAFDAFYHGMYVPYARARFGAESVVSGIHRLRRVFRAGGLVLVEREATPLAAALFMRRGSLFKLVALGTPQGGREAVGVGGFWAIYAFCLHLAQRIGCDSVDFGASRPNLGDGALRYKRKWGVALVDKENSHHDLLVHWNSMDGPVLDFLHENPIVFRGAGGPWGIASALRASGEMPATDPAARIRSLWMPGLGGLVVIDRSCGRCAYPPGVVAIDPGAGGDRGPAGIRFPFRQG